MGRQVEFVNPNARQVQLAGPNKELVTIKGYSRIVLDEWSTKYSPRHIKVVRVLGSEPAKNLNFPRTVRKKGKTVLTTERRSRLESKQKKAVERKDRSKTKSGVKIKYKKRDKGAKAPPTVRREAGVNKTVGRGNSRNINIKYKEVMRHLDVPISNNIGVGILSYNRLSSLKRCLASIRKYTDLSRTTIFVSDESTDPSVGEWLNKQNDICVIRNVNRLGVAGNTNRLLRCLSRFKFGYILNDDVEILRDGWEHFYLNAASELGYHHFCYRQVGLMGARDADATFKKIKGYRVSTIADKPQGGVLAFTNKAFRTVGYFDESMGEYGMEHVDWSNRVSLSELQPAGYHDIDGSKEYFKIHRETSAVLNRSDKLRTSKAKYDKVKNNKRRIFVDPGPSSDVQSLSVIIPIRDTNNERNGSIKSVISNIRGQLFPNIELIIVENDANKNFRYKKLEPLVYKYTPYGARFQKSRAFNVGVKISTHGKVVLHDADILVDARYLSRVNVALKKHDGCHIGSEVLYLDDPSTKIVNTKFRVDNSLRATRMVTYFEGGSIACHKNTFWNVGGFNEEFEGYGCEDCDFF